VLEKYPDDVKYVFKHFPLNNHKFAMPAAVAALAAERQGKFWEFHDKLYESYNRLSQQKIQAISKELGLDAAQFEKDKKDPRLTAMINRDRSEGIKAGVTGTPAVFLNGKLLRNRRMAGFQAAIEKELQKRAVNRRCKVLKKVQGSGFWV
jgi:protein-disulfide isomerase